MKKCPQCNQRYPSDSSFCFVDGASLVAAKDPRIGSTVASRYVIEDTLGEGGMATVYRARHKLVDRPYAIKILKGPSAQDAILQERFRREARHAQRLAHPNIIEIYDQGETEDGAPFLVMELLEGTSLADAMDGKRISLQRALPIWVQMTRALARAHDFDVVHRDLKPENVFLTAKDRVKLLDFGLARCLQDARLTTAGEIFGTPQYMAPERGTSIDAGTPADLYSLGVILFEMVAGRLPFDAPDAPTWLMKHAKEPVPRLRQFSADAAESLDLLIYQLMAKDPADRPVDARRVLADLEAVARELGIALPEDPQAGSRPIAAPSSPADVDLWTRRAELFSRMLQRGFPSGAPPDIERMLTSLSSHLRELTELRARAADEQHRLESVEQEAREGRLQLGRAMDALTFDLSRARQDARELRARLEPLQSTVATFAPEVLAGHREVIHWEGRSGFAEPYRELVTAYRSIADRIEAWYAVRQSELAATAEAVEKERALADLDQQVTELRNSLEALEERLTDRRRECQERLGEMGRRAEELEQEMLHLATRFCAPLRAKPELGQLFLELERDRVKSATG